MCVWSGEGEVTVFLYAAVIDKYPGEHGHVRSVKPWIYLFSTHDPHSLVVRSTPLKSGLSTLWFDPHPGCMRNS